MATATDAPEVDDAPAPAGPKPKKLTLAKAIDQWADCDLAIAGLSDLRKEAAAVLLENAERTGKRAFKDRIAVVQTGGSLVLDQLAAREMLGDRTPTKRTKLGLALQRLK